MVKIAKYVLPAFTACYFMYGDEEGIHEDDIKALKQFETQMKDEHGTFNCISCDSEPSFMACHALKDLGVGSADSVIFYFDVEKNEGDYS